MPTKFEKVSDLRDFHAHFILSLLPLSSAASGLLAEGRSPHHHREQRVEARKAAAGVLLNLPLHELECFICESIAWESFEDFGQILRVHLPFLGDDLHQPANAHE